MKKREFIKRAIDNNVADKDLILQNVLDDCSLEKQVKSRKTRTYSRIAFRAAAAFLVFAVVFGFNFDDVTTPNVSSPDAPNLGSKTNPEVVKKQKNSFKVFAYTLKDDEGTNPDNSRIDESKKVELRINDENQIASGKIKRGKRTSYVDAAGKEFKGYEVTYESNLGLVCSGENIKSVIYTSSNEELHYFDVEMLKEMERKGELFVCRIPISSSKFDINTDYDKVHNTFREMWASGELDEYKDKYFNGKDTNLDNYEIAYGNMFDGTGNMYVEIKERQNGDPPYFQRGTTVKVGSNNGEWPVEWIPAKTMEVLQSERFSGTYEDLPHDTITVNVEFEDGEIVTKTINLSFDKEGNLVAKLIG